MEFIWRDVHVPSWVVEGDGFTTDVGGTVRMPLELYCQFWTPATERDRPGPVAVQPGTHHHPDFRSVHELVGVAVPTEAVWWNGWMFDVAGLLLYVTPAPDPNDPEMAHCNVHLDPESQTGDPIPATPVRARGQLSMAEDHVTSGFEPHETLLQRATRTWSVRRIVRLGAGGRHRDVQTIDRSDYNTNGYHLDIAEVAQQPAAPTRE